jgi:hypothetical protein
MSDRTAPLVYRPSAAAPAGARSESMLCRWCGSLAGFGRGDIFHIDRSPGGRSWAEHGSCARSKPRRDWLSTKEEKPWRLP